LVRFLDLERECEEEDETASILIWGSSSPISHVLVAVVVALGK
jgi:hypothetical protein